MIIHITGPHTESALNLASKLAKQHNFSYTTPAAIVQASLQWSRMRSLSRQSTEFGKLWHSALITGITKLTKSQDYHIVAGPIQNMRVAYYKIFNICNEKIKA